MTEPIRILVADDDQMARAMLSALIASEPSFELAGAARNTGEAIEFAAEKQPDIVLLDLDMPGGGGYMAAKAIGERSERTQVIALTALDTPETQLEMMRAGAVYFLVKGASNEEIVETINSAVHWRSGEDPKPEANGSAPDTLPERVAALEARVAALERAAVQTFAANLPPSDRS